MDLAGRSYARVYDVQGRSDVHAFLRQAVEASGAQVLHASPASRAPVYLGVRTATGERLGLLVYPFRMTRVITGGRPSDEVRGQVRYGAEASWDADDHYLGRDVAGVDTTLVLNVHLQSGVLVGLDPALYDPLPMGISTYAKDEQLARAAATGWYVWTKENKPGRRRGAPRAARRGAADSLETLVAFTPDRLLDYARLERTASELGLDTPLRFTAAHDAATASPALTRSPAVGSAAGPARAHQLEADFDLAAEDILAIIAERSRLQVAVRGGVAEHHLERQLRADPQVATVRRLDQDALHDFDVVLADGTGVRVECKNASPETYASGDYKVEVQKTRASKGDPASRYYRADQFDVVAACLYSPTRQWAFRFALTASLTRHAGFPTHLAAMQRVDATWTPTLAEAVRAATPRAPGAPMEAAGSAPTHGGDERAGHEKY